jgi:hypothetical protein
MLNNSNTFDLFLFTLLHHPQASRTSTAACCVVDFLIRFNSNPGPKHWEAVKHLMRYLKGTLDYKLTFGGQDLEEAKFTTYCDASHGDCPDSGRSTGGYVTVLAGGAIGWSSKLQPFVTLSTTEAEYVAAVEAGKEILWMRNLMQEMQFPVTVASPLRIDNQSALSVTKNPEHHGRMKQLDLRYFWLRDTVEQKIIAPDFIPGAEQVADSLTKALPIPKIEFCRKEMGLVDSK